MRIGAAFRAVRKRRGWRQSDVAARAGVSQSFVSLVERGHLDLVSPARLRAIGRVLDVRIDLYARWRGGSLDRMLSLRHSLLADSVAARFKRWPGWVLAPEVSFSIYGERGVIDLLAFHLPSRSLLVIDAPTKVVVIGWGSLRVSVAQSRPRLTGGSQARNPVLLLATHHSRSCVAK